MFQLLVNYYKKKKSLSFQFENVSALALAALQFITTFSFRKFIDVGNIF